MKKLLLLSLLVIGSTSFAAIQGSETAVSMPIQSIGNVIVPTGSKLIIESKTGGMNGDVMSFQFGDLTKPDSGAASTIKVLEGGFTVRKASGSFNGIGSSTNELQVGLNATGVEKTKTSGTTEGLPTGITIAYNLSGDLDSSNEVYNGRITATATVTDKVTNATTFTDNAQRVYAVITTP